MVKVDAAVLGRTIKSTAASLTASADLLQDCLDEGMPWTVLGSVEAAVALWVSYGRLCSQLRPALWVWGLGQTMTLPGHTGAAVPGDILCSEEITCAMLSTPIRRRSAIYRESLDEIGDAVEKTRPGFNAMISTVRKAKAFCGSVHT